MLNFVHQNRFGNKQLKEWASLIDWRVWWDKRSSCSCPRHEGILRDGSYTHSSLRH